MTASVRSRARDLKSAEKVKKTLAANGIASFEQLSFAQTDTSNMAVSVYERSKTLAEQAAWNFIRTEGEGLEFVTINPVAILGPSLGSAPSDSSSFTMHISKRGK